VDDTLDSLFDDDEEAEDAVMSQILDEIGIEVSDKVWTAGLCVCVLQVMSSKEEPPFAVYLYTC